MSYDAVLDMAVSTWGVLAVVFKWLGLAVTAGMAVDLLVPDSIDKGFMGKLLKVPVLGSILSSLKRFSPFNVKVEKK